MDAARYRRVCEVFEAALEVDADLREAWVAESCADDSEIRRGVERALAEMEVRTGFLETSPFAGVLGGFAARRETPARIGDYDVVRLLGVGGMGEVWLAERDGVRVALKLLRSAVDSPEARRRFEHEAMLLARVRHPSIARVLDAGVVETEEGRTPYLALQFVEGDPLLPRQAELPGRAELPDLLQRFEIIARALHAAHEAGVIHRDVKPQNVILTPDGAPVLIDFGIARDAEGQLETLTRSGFAPGTPVYMSPEQVSGRKHVDRRTDVWSLGVLLYESLTLQRPFEAPTCLDLYEMIRSREPMRVRRLNPKVPPAVEAIVETALAKDPESRYATAEALADDLRAASEGTPVSVRPATTVTRVMRWVRREPRLAAAALLAVIGLGVIAGLTGYIAARWGTLEEGRRSLERREIALDLERAFIDLGEGRTDAAEGRLEDVLLRDPRSVEALAGLAVARLVGGRFAGAIEALDGAPGLVEEHPSLRWIRVDALALLGRGAEADALARRLGDGSARTAAGCFVQGLRAQRRAESGNRGAWAEALAHYTRAIHFDEAARPLHVFSRARAAHEAGDGAAAEECADVLTVRWPDSSHAWFFAAWALQGVDPTRSLAAWRQAVRLAPEDAAAWTNLGNALQAVGSLDEAIVAHERAVRIAGRAAAYSNLGSCLYRSGRLDAAQRALRTALALDDRLAAAHVNLADLLRSRGKDEEALGHARRAIAADPGLAPAHDLMGQMLRDAGRREEALTSLLRAAALDADDAWIRNRLGDLQRTLGMLPEAEASFREAIRLEADEASHHVDLATITLATGRHAEAIASCRRALALRADHVPALVNLGGALRDHGRVHESISVLHRALELEQASPELHLTLGIALRFAGRSRAGLKHLTRGKELLEVRGADVGPVTSWIAETQRILAEETEQEARLRAIVEEGAAVRGPEEARLMAAVALRVGRPEAARDLFEGTPRDSLSTWDRYDFACALLLTGGDRGPALDLLERALSDLEEAAGEGRMKARILGRTLRGWQDDPDLAALRDPEGLGDAERARAAELWEEVADVLAALDA